MTYLLMLVLILVALYIYIIILYIRYMRRTNELAEDLTAIALILEAILNTLLEYEEKSNYWGE